LIEFIRINPRSFLGMTNAQTASVVSIALGILLLLRAKEPKLSAEPTAKS
jgi:predicted NUDIX family phosphoesterase